MKTTTVGIDLAKNVFQVHGVNEHSKRFCRIKRFRPNLSLIPLKNNCQELLNATEPGSAYQETEIVAATLQTAENYG